MLTGKLRVLIVDDENGIRELFRANLEEEGYECHTAESSEAALEVLASTEFEVALVDITMPRMTGLSLFQHMKELYPDIAVVFITAVDDLSLAVEHLKSGAYDYIVKPLTRTRLQQAVEGSLAKRKTGLEQRQHRRMLEERVPEQTQELEARIRELASLNRMFQTELSAKFTTEEAAYLKVHSARDRQRRRRRMSIQESEKKRISEYLHGHVQSKLLVLQRRLSQCQETLVGEPEKASALLEEIAAGLRSVQEQDIRKASHDLYPSIVKVGLVPSVRSLCERFRSVLPVELYIEPAIEAAEENNWRTFPEELKIGIYRMVEEAMDNVIKHARAEVASVELYREMGGHICLDVADDGRGFETGKSSSVLGLLAMNDYAEALGGRCRIESAPGQGTKVHVSIPVRAVAWESTSSVASSIPGSERSV